MRKIFLFLMTNIFLVTNAQENVYFFINYPGPFDPTKLDEYRETLFSYANHPNQITEFNHQEKLFNYFGFKEAFLKEIFKEYKVILTNTFENLQNVKYIVTQEVPRDDKQLKLFQQYPKEKRILFTIETQISNPRSHEKEYYEYYDKVFTWNQEYVDNKKIFWLPAWILWTDVIPMISAIIPFEQKKLCCVVSGFHNFDHPLANHSKRIKFIDLCEKKAQGQFDIYGKGWKNYKNWKGLVSFNGDRRMNKINTIKNYKFYLCYENTKDIYGYITEKIFECLAAGCVPIYSGARDIAQYVPKNCFIARSDFKKDKDLLQFIQNMDKNTYDIYLKNIKTFLESPQVVYLSRSYHAAQIRKALGLQAP